MLALTKDFEFQFNNKDYHAMVTANCYYDEFDEFNVDQIEVIELDCVSGDINETEYSDALDHLIMLAQEHYWNDLYDEESRYSGDEFEDFIDDKEFDCYD